MNNKRGASYPCHSGDCRVLRNSSQELGMQTEYLLPVVSQCHRRPGISVSGISGRLPTAEFGLEWILWGDCDWI